MFSSMSVISLTLASRGFDNDSRDGYKFLKTGNHDNLCSNTAETCRYDRNLIAAALFFKSTTNGRLQDEPISPPQTFFLFLLHAGDKFALLL